MLCINYIQSILYPTIYSVSGLTFPSLIVALYSFLGKFIVTIMLLNPSIKILVLLVFAIVKFSLDNSFTKLTSFSLILIFLISSLFVIASIASFLLLSIKLHK
ncbi:hypothetical protein SCITRI_00538 [Spiroplasma citri]|nr:hypothetical protein SCITRI_00538 [Spiroplasma citri]